MPRSSHSSNEQRAMTTTHPGPTSYVGGGLEDSRASSNASQPCSQSRDPREDRDHSPSSKDQPGAPITFVPFHSPGERNLPSGRAITYRARRYWGANWLSATGGPQSRS